MDSFIRRSDVGYLIVGFLFFLVNRTSQSGNVFLMFRKERRWSDRNGEGKEKRGAGNCPQPGMYAQSVRVNAFTDQPFARLECS